MKLIFVRHGKDDENYRGGWSSLGLVPEGVEQAKQLARHLGEKNAEYGITKIISSDLPRAKETADILSLELGVPVVTDKRLREADNGDLAGMPNAEGNVLVVTHGGVINIIYHLVKHMEWSNVKKSVPVGNCSVHVLDVERMEFEVENRTDYR